MYFCADVKVTLQDMLEWLSQKVTFKCAEKDLKSESLE